MVKKIITWVDLEGRYRVTSPAYGSHPDKTEDELIDRVINQPVKGLKARYGLPDNHPFHIVEDADQKAALEACCGQYFRWPATPGDTVRDARGGAWEMDVDGHPKVNMPKARGIHMDVIRKARNTELAAKDITFMRAVEAGDTDAQATIATEKQALRDIPQTFDLTTDTPEQLKAKWPSELPARE